jgi:WD40 repeat protein
MKRTFFGAIVGCILTFMLQAAAVRAQQKQQVDRNPVNTTTQPDAIATGIMHKPIYPIGVHALRFSPDGRTIASGDGTGLLRLWNVREGKLHKEIRAHSNWVFAVHWNRDGSRIITGGGDNLIHWFNPSRSDIPEKTINVHSNDVHALALTRNGKTLYSTGDDRQIVIWDVKRDLVKKGFIAHERQVPALLLSPNEKLLASGSRDRTIRLWDAKNGKLRETLIGHTGDVMALSFSPQGNLLASAGWDHTVRLWDVRSGKAVRIFAGEPARVSGVAFSPDGKKIVSSSGPNLRAFNPANGNQLWSAQFDRKIRDEAGTETAEDLSAVTFRPHGDLVAVGSTTGAIYLVDAETGHVVHTIKPTEDTH